MRPLSVLFTNNALAGRGGSETYIRDVALALMRRGHRPIAFSLVLGDTAGELRRATVPVIDDLSRLGAPPDVIHGHHHLETLIAALTFPQTPIVHFCHGWIPWEEKPLRHPSIRRYVAVDDVCFDRLVQEEGIPPACVEVLRNFVDLDRFRARLPLPAKPLRALVLSNYASPDGYVRVIAAACAAAGIALDVVGAAHGGGSDSPETLLHSYDLVFAKGRTALEALSVGCAVVLADAAGAGPMVTLDGFDALRARNFGIRELYRPHAESWYREQIAAYDPAAASAICARVRSEAGLEPAVDRLLELYRSAVDAHVETRDGSLAAARHLSLIAQPLKHAHGLAIRLKARECDVETLRAECEQHATALSAQTATVGALRRDLDSVRRERDIALTALDQHRTALRDLEEARSRQRELEAKVALLQKRVSESVLVSDRLSAMEGELTAARAHSHALDTELARFRSLPTLRVRDAVLRIPLLGAALRAAARRIARARPLTEPKA